MKKHIVFVSAGSAVFLLLAACGSPGTASVVPQDTASSASSVVASPEVSSRFSAPEAVARVIPMTVHSWAFSPTTVTVKRGEKAVIHLTNTGGNHSFVSEALGINVAVPQGQFADITIPTDTAGTFAFHCGVPCGEGHKDMTGQIVVE